MDNGLEEIPDGFSFRTDPSDSLGEVTFESTIHRSQHSVVHTVYELLTDNPRWRGSRVKLIKRTLQRSPRRRDLLASAYRFIWDLEVRGKMPAMLAPVASLSPVHSREQWDLYPLLPSTLTNRVLFGPPDDSKRTTWAQPVVATPGC